MTIMAFALLIATRTERTKTGPERVEMAAARQPFHF
jgi:hypothetical protein